MVLYADSGFCITNEPGIAPAPIPYKFLDTSTGAYLSIGGSWESASDKNVKENFEDIDFADVLEQVAALDVTRWNYKAESPEVRHIGPMAQDFHRQFGVGFNDKTISSIDASGIALAAIKALHAKTTELEKRSNETQELKQRVDELTRLVEQLIQEKSLSRGGR